MQIGTIQEHLQKFFELYRCGGLWALYTFVPQTAKGWQPVLLGTNCQPFFVAYAAPQGHLVRQESRVDLHSAAVCCTKV